MSAHTPGPWERYMDRVVANVAHHGMHGSLQDNICELRGCINIEANAALIAAAPDMVAALKASLALGNKIYHNANAHEAVHDWATVKKLMEAALAKAGAL